MSIYDISDVLTNQKVSLTQNERNAVIRCATKEDFLGLARMLERSYFPTHQTSFEERKARRNRIRSVAKQLIRPRSKFLVIEIEGSLCASNYFRIGNNYRIFSSNGSVTSQGRDFDSRLVMRLAEHFINCCQIAGWPELHFFATFENIRAVQIFATYFSRKKNILTKVSEPQLTFFERMLFGNFKHYLHMQFMR